MPSTRQVTGSRPRVAPLDLRFHDGPQRADAIMACTGNLDFMRPLPDESMHLIVTSPPYNLGKAYEHKEAMDGYVAQQKRVIIECARLLHPRGSICWQIGNYVENGEIVPLDILVYPELIWKVLKLF